MATKPTLKIGKGTQSQTELIDSAELAQALIKSAGTGIYIVQDGNFVYVSSLFRELTDYSEEELIGTYSLNHVHPKDRSLVRKKAIESLKENNPLPYEYRFIKKNGDILWVLEKVTSTEYRGKRSAVGSFMDITERKRIEDELKSSEERLKILFEFAPDAYYLNDMRGTFVDGNKAAEEMMGYRKDELIGNNFLKLKLLSPKQITKAAKLLAKNALGQPTGPDEFILNRKDGKQIVADIRTIPAKIKGKSFVLGIAHDITERKQMEESLRESESRYRDLFDNASDIIQSVAPDGHFIYVNKAWQNVLGYSEKEVDHLTIWDVVHPDSINHCAEVFQMVMSGEAVDDVETVFMTKDGMLITVEGHVNCRLERGKPAFTRAIFRDITERKRMEEALRQSEERYRTILEETEDGYFEVDLAGNFTFFNDATCRKLGYSREELMGMNYRVYTGEKDIATVYKVFNDVYQTGEPVEGFSWEAIRSDGTRRFAEVSVSPIRSKEGEIIGFRGVSHDVTERKRMEEELRKRTYDLGERVKEIDCLYSISELFKEKSISLEELVQKAVNLVPSAWQYPEITCARCTVEGKEFSTDNWVETNWKQAQDIIVRGDQVGVLEVGYVEEKPVVDEGPFMKEERTLINTIAVELGKAIENRLAEEDLREAEEKFRSISASAMDAIIMIDSEGKVTYWNKAAEDIFGYSNQEILGKDLHETLTPQHYGESIRTGFSKFKTSGQGMAVGKTLELVGLKKDRTEFPVELSMSAVKLKGKWHAIGIVRDITERKQMERRLEEMATHDTLTGLPNRRLFSDRLNVALVQAQRNSSKLAVMMFDLDKFKNVNDTLGHDVGDTLLKAVSERLKRLLRKGDTIARLGGDEFILLLPQINRKQDATRIATKILEAFEEPFVCDGNELHVTTSIGIAIYPDHGADADSLIKNADIAMYSVKERCRGSYEVYKAEKKEIPTMKG